MAVPGIRVLLRGPAGRLFRLVSALLVFALVFGFTFGGALRPFISLFDTSALSANDPRLIPGLHEPEGTLLHRVVGNNYDPDNPKSDRIDATLLVLARNSDLREVIMSMRELESAWNRKFNYPWLFLNNKPFSDEFKKAVSAETNAKTIFDLVPAEHWDVPKWIDRERWARAKARLAPDVQRMNLTSYHQMCRYESGFFFRHPAMSKLRWYWRVEPGVNFFCDVDYDVFRFMRDAGKLYGFNVALYDSPQSVETLWPVTQQFLSENPGLQHPNGLPGWVTDSARKSHHKIAKGYSTCHYWSNFEIADLNFFRSDTYMRYFEYLDKTGGFYYERWGDAPVHSIALSLFENRERIHWFRDIGYHHAPFRNCPNSPKCAGCDPRYMYAGKSFLSQEDCMPRWLEHMGTPASSV